MRRPNGTREWLGALYDRHAPALYRYAVMVLADRDAAGDVVQQVFARLVESDDGGDVDPQTPPPGQRTQPPTDVGIRIALH